MLRRLLSTLGLALALTASVTPAQAATETRIGDTTGGLTFNRPLADFSGLSAVGTAVAYDLFSFSVTEAGTYTFRNLTLPREPGWDGFLLLYANGFDASAPLLNGIAGNDDFNGNVRLSGFDVTLNTGVAYTLVTTGFDNDDAGRFLGIYRGPGEFIAPVPEASTVTMLLAGLGAVAFLARRRRAD